MLFLNISSEPPTELLSLRMNSYITMQDAEIWGDNSRWLYLMMWYNNLAGNILEDIIK